MASMGMRIQCYFAAYKWSDPENAWKVWRVSTSSIFNQRSTFEWSQTYENKTSMKIMEKYFSYMRWLMGIARSKIEKLVNAVGFARRLETIHHIGTLATWLFFCFFFLFPWSIFKLQFWLRVECDRGDTLTYDIRLCQANPEKCQTSECDWRVFVEKLCPSRNGIAHESNTRSARVLDRTVHECQLTFAGHETRTRKNECAHC